MNAVTDTGGASKRPAVSYQEKVGEELDFYREITALDGRNGIFTTPRVTKQALELVPVSNAVPENAKALIRRVGSLLMHAFLDYEFNDVASEIALLYVESALRLRLGKPFKKGEWLGLHGLVKEAREKGLLPARYTERILDATFGLRNHTAHAGGQEMIGPVLAMTAYHRLVDMVNCLYDEECRQHEPEVFVQWRRQMEEMNAEVLRIERERRNKGAGETG